MLTESGRMPYLYCSKLAVISEQSEAEGRNFLAGISGLWDRGRVSQIGLSNQEYPIANFFGNQGGCLPCAQRRAALNKEKKEVFLYPGFPKASVGGWRLVAVGGWWRLVVVGGPYGWSLTEKESQSQRTTLARAPCAHPARYFYEDVPKLSPRVYHYRMKPLSRPKAAPCLPNEATNHPYTTFNRLPQTAISSGQMGS